MSERLMRLQEWAQTVEQPPPEVCSEDLLSRLVCLRRRQRSRITPILDDEQPKHRKRKRKPLPPPVYDD